MTKLIVNAVLLVWCFLYFIKSSNGHGVFCKTPDVRDYYWREYVGVIPYDAVAGGVDKMGLTTYIGQVVLYPYGTVVASIYQGNKTVVTSYINTIYTDVNVQILCSNSPEKFKWIPTDIDKIQLITNCHLIVGHVDHEYQGNIGRANFDNQILLGKILRMPLSYQGMYVPYNGNETKLTHYEVLGYDCK